MNKLQKKNPALVKVSTDDSLFELYDNYINSSSGGSSSSKTSNSNNSRKNNSTNNSDNINNNNKINNPSINLLNEIQKSVSYKLATRYKFRQQDKDKILCGDDENHNERNVPNDKLATTSATSTTKKVEKNKKEMIKKTNVSNQIKHNSSKTSRYPLSEPLFNSNTNFNEICGPEILMAIGVIQQNHLKSLINQLSSTSDTSGNRE
ncbi:hypothetical protein CYY_005999 [Polysphondylium violaceum]|uniref:Uncharacterized protein n=1 Tax=Polysphondylium violaceum TaxID=133409 RepID=A0A8J4PR58_9MYCE|nr:hypothetical protein CYY_005999 [Polysphondylium violaceum]